MISYPDWPCSYPEQDPKLENRYFSASNLFKPQDLSKFINTFSSLQVFSDAPLFQYTNSKSESINILFDKVDSTYILDGYDENPFVTASQYADKVLNKMVEKDPTVTVATIEMITDTSNVSPYIHFFHENYTNSELLKKLSIEKIDQYLIESVRLTLSNPTSSIYLIKALPF